MRSHPCCGSTEACPRPQPWSLHPLSILFPAGEGVTVQAGRQVSPGPHLSRITTQTPLSLNPSIPWQPRDPSQNLRRRGPKCSVAPGRLHLKVWPRGSKPHADAADLSFGDLPSPPCQGGFHGVFTATGPGKPHSGASALQDMSFLSLPCSAPYMNTFLSLYFFFPFGIYFFFLFPITPLMQSRTADYKRGSLTRAIGLLH